MIVKHIIPRIFIVGCTFLILLPTFMLIGLLPAKPDAHEKRAKAKFPDFPKNLADLKKWPGEVDIFFSDNIPNRGYFIGLHARIKYFVFRSSPVKDVLIGKEGWLFHNLSLPNDEIQGLLHREPYQVRRMRVTLEERRDWLAERDIAYLVLIAPSKHYAYYDKLPGWFNVNFSKPDRKSLLFNELKNSGSNLSIFDFSPSIMKARKQLRDNIFYKQDTHWNYTGAYIAYESLAEWCPQWFSMPNSSWKSVKKEREGNLMQMMGIKCNEISYQKLPPDGFKFIERGTDKTNEDADKNRNYRIIFEQPGEQKPKLFILGDSFLGWNAHYLAYNFSRTVIMNPWGDHWSRFEQFPSDEIENVKPNLVIDQMVENRLDLGNSRSVLTDPKGKNHPENIREARLKRLCLQAGLKECSFEVIQNEIIITIPKESKGRKAFIINLEIICSGAQEIESTSPYTVNDKWEDLCIRGAEMTSRKINRGETTTWICASTKPSDTNIHIRVRPLKGSMQIGKVKIAVHPDI